MNKFNLDWTSTAIADLKATWDYIAIDNEAAADRTIDRTVLEMKLQDVGGDKPEAAASETSTPPAATAPAVPLSCDPFLFVSPDFVFPDDF